MAALRGDGAALKRLEDVYAKFPSLPDNTLTREAARLLGEGRCSVSGACEQQELIHLYREAVQGRLAPR